MAAGSVAQGLEGALDVLGQEVQVEAVRGGVEWFEAEGGPPVAGLGADGRDDEVIAVGDDPGGRGVGAPALTGEPAQPSVERIVAAVELAAVVPPRG